jgi:hypothetical protein
MPNWKKIIISGSNAELNSLTVTTNITASFFTGSFVGDGVSLTNISGSSLYDNVRTVAFELGVSSTEAITTGAKGRKTIPYLGTIVGWRLVADQSSTVQLDVWKRNNAIPTLPDSIVASAYPALTAAELNSSTTLTGWTTSVSPDDVFILNVDSNDSATYLALELDILLT